MAVVRLTASELVRSERGHYAPETSNKGNKSVPISSQPLSKKYVTVNGRQMAYHDEGEGDAVVF